LARNLSIVDLLTLETEPFSDSRHPGKTFLKAATSENRDRAISGVTLVMFRAGAPRYESCGTTLEPTSRSDDCAHQCAKAGVETASENLRARPRLRTKTATTPNQACCCPC